MTDKIAIRVSHMNKQYRHGGTQEQYHTLRDAMLNSLKAPFKEFHSGSPDEGFLALKNDVMTRQIINWVQL
jgi:hypothetical protein